MSVFGVYADWFMVGFGVASIIWVLLFTDSGDGV